MSCTRTRRVLDDRKIVVGEERSSTKAPLVDAEVGRLLGEVDTVILAKGKGSRRIFVREVALDDLRGPTGKFRAPMVRKGKTLLVGFSEEQLEKLLG